MEITGRIIAVLAPRSGVSASGKDWKVQEFVIEETNQQYPKKVCFEVFGEDKLQQLDLHEGIEYKVSFDIDARQWKDRWFNSIRAWKAERIQNGMSNAPQPQQQTFADPFAPAAATASTSSSTSSPSSCEGVETPSSNTAPPPESDDLPF